MEIWGKLSAHKEGSLSFNESVSLFFTIWPEKESSLAKFFKTEDKFSWNKLTKALDEKYNELENNSKQSEFKSFTPPVLKFNNINVDVLPEALRIEHAKIAPNFRRRSQLHARLLFPMEQSERYKLCAEIVEISSECRAIFNMLDSFNQSGFYEPKQEMAKTEKINVSQIRNYKVEDELRKLMSRRSKAKNNKAKIDEFNELNRQIEELRAKRYA